jgi:hypothetical protein
MALANAAALATTSAYLSPAKYRGFSCAQLLLEGRGISMRASALAGERNVKGADANTEPTVVLPAVLNRNGNMSGELAVLRGQMQAIEEAAIESQCEIEFVPATNK